MLRLSSQQYAAVVATFQSIAAKGNSNKRMCTRMDIQAPVRVGIMAEGKVTRALIALSRDISLTGIGLCQSMKFADNESFLVSLPCAKKPMVLLCKSTFCRPLADGIFCIGAQFEAEADAAQCEEFRAIAAHKAAA